MQGLMILGLIVVAFLGYAVVIYNKLQNLKTQITASIQEIGNNLKRQASLIPNLEANVKGYLKHEKGVFKELADARKSIQTATASGSAQKMSAVADQLTSLIPRIQVAVEDNPEMKADKTVTKFMDELRDTADKLLYARRSLIDLSQVYNALLVTFPSNLVANVFSFKAEKGLSTPVSGEHIEVGSDDIKDVKVDITEE